MYAALHHARACAGRVLTNPFSLLAGVLVSFFLFAGSITSESQNPFPLFILAGFFSSALVSGSPGIAGSVKPGSWILPTLPLSGAIRAAVEGAVATALAVSAAVPWGVAALLEGAPEGALSAFVSRFDLRGLPLVFAGALATRPIVVGFSAGLSGGAAVLGAGAVGWWLCGALGPSLAGLILSAAAAGLLAWRPLRPRAPKREAPARAVSSTPRASGPTLQIIARDGAAGLARGAGTGLLFAAGATALIGAITTYKGRFDPELLAESLALYATMGLALGPHLAPLGAPPTPGEACRSWLYLPLPPQTVRRALALYSAAALAMGAAAAIGFGALGWIPAVTGLATAIAIALSAPAVSLLFSEAAFEPGRLATPIAGVTGFLALLLAVQTPDPIKSYLGTATLDDHFGVGAAIGLAFIYGAWFVAAARSRFTRRFA